MSVTSRFKDSSKRLVSRFGTLRKYKRKTGEVYDVDTQMNVESFTEYEIKIYKAEPREREIKSPNLVNKEVTVMMVAAADLPSAPVVGDIISDKSPSTTEVFRVEVISEFWAGDSVSVYKLICSRS